MVVNELHYDASNFPCCNHCDKKFNKNTNIARNVKRHRKTCPSKPVSAATVEVEENIARNSKRHRKTCPSKPVSAAAVEVEENLMIRSNVANVKKGTKRPNSTNDNNHIKKKYVEGKNLKKKIKKGVNYNDSNVLDK